MHENHTNCKTPAPVEATTAMSENHTSSKTAAPAEATATVDTGQEDQTPYEFKHLTDDVYMRLWALATFSGI